MSKMRKTVPQIDSGIPIPPVVEDLIGQKFGRLLVIERAENYVFPNGTTASRWLCRCDCGRKKIIMGQSLRWGATNSCGCLCGEKTAERRRATVSYVVGQRFGRLVVLSQNGGWCQVRCDCMTERTVRSRDLISGKIDSCGCLKIETLEAIQRAKVIQHWKTKGRA